MSARPTAVVPTSPVVRPVTDLLLRWGRGDESALEQLIPIVHAELRRVARRQIRGERDGQTLQTTALVNEAYLRIVDLNRMSWQDRAHFFAMSARLMRRILIDHARARRSRKRGAGAFHVTLSGVADLAIEPRADLVALDDALKALAVLDARKSQVVELRFFAGLTVDETAVVLRVSPETVARDWRLAKVWLLRELRAEARPADE